MAHSTKRPLDEWFWQLKDCRSDSLRANLLAQVREADPEAATELEKMLRVSNDLGSFMNLADGPHPAFDAAYADEPRKSHKKDATSLASRLPKQIGLYRLLEPIGEGGMGIVYLAQQTKPVRRNVAIKIIRPGMDSRQVIARFEAERQALAMMEHPNIASVLDAGTTESGLPYFVMELVRGLPMTEYCDRAKVDTRSRLELFLSACSALQHAHNKGIIHRDIKPTNILVTQHDGTPVVKVIDFGVAKALTANLTEMTLYTGVFQMIGTPLYMSPEQASLSGLDVDTRSDVYSLGVLLYELISGTLPMDRQSVKEMSYEQLRHHICNTVPPRPSQRISTQKEQRDNLADTHPISVSHVATTIDRELDWIVMRAIEKDRQRRYQSPRELADDLNRYLNGQTVQACPPTLAYRAQKLLRQHKTSLAIAATVLLSLAASTIVSTSQAIKATKASAVANNSSQLAQQKANELAEFVYAEEMVAASKHYLSGEQTKFEQILQRHASRDRDDLHGFEWDFLNGLQPVETRILFETDECIWDLAISSDQQHLILGDAGGNLLCIDRSSGAELATFKSSNDPILAVDISQAGTLSFVGTAGEIAFCQWDESLDLSPQSRIPLSSRTLSSLVSNGNVQWVGDAGGQIYEHDQTTRQTRTLYDGTLQKTVRDLVATPNGGLIAAHRHELVQILPGRGASHDASTDLWRLPLNSTMAEIRDMDLNHDTRLLVCAQLLGGVSLFQLTGSEPQHLFTQLLPDDLHSVAISPDGEWLAAGDASGRVHLLPTQLRYANSFLDSSASRKRQLRSWRAHDAKIENLSFCPAPNSGGWEILSAGRDGRLVVSVPFKAPSVHFVTLDDQDNACCLSAQANGELFWAHLLWNLQRDDPRFCNGKVGNHPFSRVIRLKNISETEEIAVLLDERTLLKIPKAGWGIPEVLWETDANTRAVEFAVAPGTRHFAICFERLNPKRHSIHIYENGSTQPIHSIACNLANDIVFSPAGNLLAYVWNNDIVIVDVVTGRRLHQLRLHTDSIHDIDFSRDGTRLASVSSDRRLAVWNVATGTLCWSQQAHENRALDVAFHPTLPTIATVGLDSFVRFWSTRDHVVDDSVRLVGEFPLSVGQCGELAFSHDGKRLYVYHVTLGVTELTGSVD